MDPQIALERNRYVFETAAITLLNKNRPTALSRDQNHSEQYSPESSKILPPVALSQSHRHAEDEFQLGIKHRPLREIQSRIFRHKSRLGATHSRVAKQKNPTPAVLVFRQASPDPITDYPLHKMFQK